MIPIRLTIRDFLSYADPDPIDFTGFRVACLTGSNGAGKSAILDALTWSIFGAARGCEGGQNQDRLIRDGADEALVDFEFALGDVRYRIVRRRSRAGRSELRFLVGDGEDWTNLADETLRETEARIAATLRMDYKTFTASAFFVQGRAEDFLARMKPDERKEVFARLLDLGVYDELEEAARRRARDAEIRRAEHARRVEALADVDEEASKLAEELAAKRKHAAESEAAVETAEADAERQRVAVGELEKIEARRAGAREAVNELTRTLEDIDRIVEQRTSELSDVEDLLSRSEEVEGALAELKRLAAVERDFQDASRQAAQLTSRRAAVLERIEGDRNGITARIDERGKVATRLGRELNELEGSALQLARVEAALEGSEDPRPAIEECRRSASEQRSEAARASEQLNSIQTALEEIAERRAMLAKGEGDCPVCGSPLDGDHRERVSRALSTQQSDLARRKKEAQAAASTARKEAARLDEEIKRLEAAMYQRDKLVSSMQTLRTRLESRSSAQEELSRLTAQIEADEAVLADGSFAAALTGEAASLAAEIAQVYDARSHEELRSRIASLEPYAAFSGRLTEASARRAAIEAELEGLRARADEARRTLTGRKTTLRELDAAVEALPGARSALTAAQAEVENRRRRAAETAQDIARISERLEAARRAVAEREAAADTERSCAAEHRLYRRLVEAFGRGGIPDLIIDNARPDLEQDANDILGRLTDYEMSLQFEMQRETRSGKAKETFDVLVHHDGGLRDYAMYSGGEAFRIAFAVRLALSKLLVGRAGARLETLVIDEGFGTQDPRGRERLIEAIRFARRDFGKVLVITHMDDLKDLFEAHIEVSKEPARGSTVRVRAS